MIKPFEYMPSPVMNFFNPQADAVESVESGTRSRIDAEETVNQVESDVNAVSGGEGSSEASRSSDTVSISQEAQEIQELETRDAEVRAHELAHAAAGGSYAGSPQYELTRGPDGKMYATSGEVSIDTAQIPGDPQATLKKADQIRAAAMAPAQPSSQDYRVASKAQAMATEARQEISEQHAAELSDSAEEGDDSGGISAPESITASASDRGQISDSLKVDIYS